MVNACLPRAASSPPPPCGQTTIIIVTIITTTPPPPPCRLDRLQYLTATLRDGGIKWHVALTMPEAEWLDMYAGYKAWWAKAGR